MDPPFDLSGWMWVEARRDDVGIIVSLQTLDQDPQSLNIHVLMDRIGVGVFGDTDNPDVGGPLFEANTTGLELPLTPEDLEELLTLVETRIADHNGSRREV